MDDFLGLAYSVFDAYLEEGRRFVERNALGRARAPVSPPLRASPPARADVSAALAALARDIMGTVQREQPQRPASSPYVFEPSDDEALGLPQTYSAAPDVPAPPLAAPAGAVPDAAEPTALRGKDPGSLVDLANVDGLQRALANSVTPQ